MKHILIFLSLFLFTSPLFGQSECDETTRARMIKSGISDKTIEEQCGKIGEKEKVSENVENEDTGEEKKVSEEDPYEYRIWRIAGGSATGTFKHTDAYNPEISGDFDHDLSGGTSTFSYFRIKEDNYFNGWGWSSVFVNADETTSKDKVPGSWTYYHTTYGYADITVTVRSFRTNFFYFLYGYNIDINDKFSFQPNLRIGPKLEVARWNEKYEFRSTNDLEYKYTESFHTLGLEIVLPFMYKINETFGIGVDLCICGSSGEYTEDERKLTRGNKYEFTNVNAFNLFFDIYL